MAKHTNSVLRRWRGLGLVAVGALVLTTCGTRVLTDAEPQSARVVSQCPTPGLSRVTGCSIDRADPDVRPSLMVAPERDAHAADPTTTLAPTTAAPATTAAPTTVAATPETPAPAPAEAAEPAPEEAAPEPDPEPETPATTRPAKKKTATTPAPAPAPAPAPEPTPEPPAPPAPEETAAPAPVRVDTSVAGRVIALINAQRQAEGAGPLTASAALNAAAARHSKDQAAHGVMTHDGSDGSTLGSRVSAAGFAWHALAENVAKGQGSADSVFNSWLNSPGHHKNMVNATYTSAGVAVAYDANGTPYWTLDLAA